jgi:CO/xanthine dehydrogenase FAD-binding subunit
MAVSLNLADDGRICAGARVVFGSVREGPVRALRTEEALAGAALDDAALEEAAGAASKELNPLPHHGFTKAYIRDNVRVYLRRILGQARDRARGAAA